MHGAGNDYLYINTIAEGEHDWPTLSVAMSDRHLGVGSDGIILIKPSDKAQLRMSMFNADGSEGEMCGNGIRCFVKYALDRDIIPVDSSLVTVETLAGILDVVPIKDNGRIVAARVSMGEPRLRPADIPVIVPGDDEMVMDYPLQVDGYSFKISCVSMGNPHAIAFIDEPVDNVALDKIGPLVEHHKMFPRRVNFEIVNIIDRATLKIRVWERGSGLTMACGTGACAVAVAARLHGHIDDDVTIGLPGGDLKVSWPGHGDVILEGPAEEIFTGEWQVS
jgi:diaminopimelate epimerase